MSARTFVSMLCHWLKHTRESNRPVPGPIISSFYLQVDLSAGFKALWQRKCIHLLYIYYYIIWALLVYISDRGYISRNLPQLLWIVAVDKLFWHEWRFLFQSKLRLDRWIGYTIVIWLLDITFYCGLEPRLWYVRANTGTQFPGSPNKFCITTSDRLQK